MKNLKATTSAVLFTVCAGASYANHIDDLRTQSFSTTQGYAQSVAAFLTKNTQKQAIAKTKEIVSASLKDPSSSQFRNVRIVDYSDGKVICGEVNGKNSYGGYVGFFPFVASTESSTLYSRDSEYPEIQSAANAGISLACK